MRLRSAVTIVVVPLLTASCATLSPVRGHVVPGPGLSGGRMKDAIVFVEPEEPDHGPAFRRTPALVVITGGRFEPRVSATALGSLIRLKNRDRVFHAPFSRSAAAPFEQLPLRPGQTREVPVVESGMVRVFCELHALESADVLVLRNGRWARVDRRGRFLLRGLPRGRYTLHAWHPVLGEHSVPIEITRPRVVRADVRY